MEAKFKIGQTIYRVSRERVMSATVLETRQRKNIYGTFTEARLVEGGAFHEPENWFANETAAHRELITILEADIKTHQNKMDRLKQLLRNAMKFDL